MTGSVLETSSDRPDFLETRPTREQIGITGRYHRFITHKLLLHISLYVINI